MKIAIVGSRDYPNLKDVDRYFESHIPKHPDTIIISGGARGVDTRAAELAQKYDLGLVTYIPDWNQFGRKAGMIRNSLIVELADKVVAFWDEESRGTKDTIDKTLKAGKDLEVILPNRRK